MNTIPNISFESSEGATDIEFLRLSELFMRMENDPDHNIQEPHRITFFALLVVTEGKGEHQVDLKEYKVSTGSVIKIAKGQVHAFTDYKNYNGYLIVFTENFVLKYFSKSSIDFISHLYNYHISKPLVEAYDYNRFFLKHIIEEFQKEDTYAQKEIIAKILELYLLRLERLSHYDLLEHFNKKHQMLFINFKNRVESHYVKTRNVKDYAEMLCVSTKFLNQVVKAFTLNTAKHFIDEFVILETKRAMVSSNYSLKEIGHAVGFDEITNFTKFFKKHTSETPKQFKMRL
ncbi:helix-turn-helix domain-containing protein [Formosa sp. L2A11]|uniref:helix-turn-helix domain-containing protein n=1 Tax=Formosa sp. L2A11 TaxID=2686363 RepID=UPI00131DE3B8|nr:helix-turn-helix domain-containing protein [Formosa sp. L2A11]